MEELPRIAGLIGKLRAASPLVHQLTNFVTVNDCANATLAIGASPVMSASEEEAPQLAAISGALLLNMGTPDEAQVRAMLAAGRAARERGVPIVFDPVGAGADEYRRALSARLLEDCGPTVVKGNAAEIAFLAGLDSAQRGVDSLESSGEAGKIARAAITLARRYSCVVLATGAVDIAADASGAWSVSGGSPELGRVCGSGCMLGSVAASFLAAAGRERALESALAAALTFKLCAEGASASGAAAKGLSSFRWAFMDALSRIGDDELEKALLPGERGERFAHVRP